MILDELRASCHAELRRPIFGIKKEASKLKMVHIFHFLPTSLVFEIVNPFSWIFNAISSEKSCLISMAILTCYLYIRILEFFPSAEYWSIHISHAPAVCKEMVNKRTYCLFG